MKKISLFFCFAFLVSTVIFNSCKKDKDTTPELTIINNGNGAVTTIADLDDYEPLAIVQTIPSGSNLSLFAKAPSAHRNGTAPKFKASQNTTLEKFPANIPVMLFFNDKVYLNSIKANIEVKVNGTSVPGTLVINESASGYAIMTFTPAEKFAANKTIKVTIKKGLQDDGGNSMIEDLVFSYETTESTNGDFENNGGFENGNAGVLFIGDGSIRMGTTGSLYPQAGEKYAAISSGNALVSEMGYAIGNASSMMILGPINKNMSTLTFYYDFISAEFNDYVDSEYDDCAIVTISGPNGSYSEFITSVNKVGFEGNTVFTGFPGMPDGGDDYTGHTGWKQHTIHFPNVGSPAYVTFTVTDVSDHILSSILAVDNIAY